jgi:hypothetical protein
MKNGKKLKLGDAQCNPKKYPRSTSVKAWGCPKAPFLHQQKYQVIFQDTIFLLLHMYVLFLECLYFFFQFSFALFAVINGWITTCLFWRETRSVFIA